jgi:hypothetical protein
VVEGETTGAGEVVVGRLPGEVDGALDEGLLLAVELEDNELEAPGVVIDGVVPTGVVTEGTLMGGTATGVLVFGAIVGVVTDGTVTEGNVITGVETVGVVIAGVLMEGTVIVGTVKAKAEDTISKVTQRETQKSKILRYILYFRPSTPVSEFNEVFLLISPGYIKLKLYLFNMSSTETLHQLTTLEGSDLYRLGRRAGLLGHGPDSPVDKGWANRVIMASVPRSARQCKIKTVPLKINRQGILWPKSALALVSINRQTILSTPFSNSALRAALNDLILVAREDEKQTLQHRSCVLGTSRFSLSESSFLYREVEADYETVRRAVREDEPLTGTLGNLVQPRTKGRGGAYEKTYAFYARPAFVASMLGL